MTESSTMADSIVDRLRDEHTQVQALLRRVDEVPPGGRAALFEQVADVLSRHEAAERALVRPRTRRTPQGGRVADSLIREEQQLDELVRRMERMDPESDGFLVALRQLRALVRDHIEHEEATELPRLESTFSTDELEGLSDRFARFEAVGPTHPHPHAPNDALSQKLVAPVVGALDRTRDAVRRLLS